MPILTTCPCGVVFKAKETKVRHCSPRCGAYYRGGGPQARFWKSTTVDRGCWLWRGTIGGTGYGQISIGHKPVPAHRFSYELHFGPIPAGAQVMHSCDNPRCVNPAHLSVGSAADNKADAVQKRRHVHGETHPRRKLTAEKAREIKNATGRYKDIAEQFGVHLSTVGFIKTGRTWRHA